MTELADVPWPPTPIRTARLLLRETEARDRPGFIDLFASDDVRRYLGGARSRSEVERFKEFDAEQWFGVRTKTDLS